MKLYTEAKREAIEAFIPDAVAVAKAEQIKQNTSDKTPYGRTVFNLAYHKAMDEMAKAAGLRV